MMDLLQKQQVQKGKRKVTKRYYCKNIKTRNILELRRLQVVLNAVYQSVFHNQSQSFTKGIFKSITF